MTIKHRFSTVLAASMVISAAGLASSTLAQSASATPTILREGLGAARAKADALELAPSTINWSGLADWTNGSAPTAADLKDKVVVVATWSGWTPASQGLIRRLDALQTREASKGLVVIAVHTDNQFELGKKFLADNNIKLLAARDVKGAVRSQLASDADPDLYLIDRAGNIRFADFESTSLDQAVTLALAESVQDAADAPKRAKDAAVAANDAARRTRTAGNAIDAGKKLNIVFVPPAVEAYEKAAWPMQNKGSEGADVGNDLQGQRLPLELGSETWLNTEDGKMPDMLGKVVVIDFWATWCGPCKRAKPMLEALARQFDKDLVMVGMTGYNDPRPQVQAFLRAHSTDMVHAYDNDEKHKKALGVSGFPTVFVISTDGKIRWQGNPHQSTFRDAVEAVVKADPGVAARRAAEQRAIDASDRRAGR